ncbi:hypothetical protein CPLU01_14219 [Colletotrichum plurivorum]|uniref:Uncharacterized protein n=1 Tax=Colletotrichum plurivorum TaxID=2175906 RepID=A0A8H6N0M2_9PEZI|nr:hypothetical protein CPLU01_14219 [Colletotrichum plurivorum]
MMPETLERVPEYSEGQQGGKYTSNNEGAYGYSRVNFKPGRLGPRRLRMTERCQTSKIKSESRAATLALSNGASMVPGKSSLSWTAGASRASQPSREVPRLTCLSNHPSVAAPREHRRAAVYYSSPTAPYYVIFSSPLSARLQVVPAKRRTTRTVLEELLTVHGVLQGAPVPIRAADGEAHAARLGVMPFSTPASDTVAEGGLGILTGVTGASGRQAQAPRL